MRKNRERTSSKIVIIVMIITLFARFFGLLREILMARYYGTSIYTDAYIIANNIPTVVFDTLGQALLNSNGSSTNINSSLLCKTEYSYSNV